jgi:hypothetical protein
VLPRVIAFNAEHPDKTVDAAVAQLVGDGLLHAEGTPWWW